VDHIECPVDESDPADDECKAFKANPREYAEKNICLECAHSKEFHDYGFLKKMLHVGDLVNSPKPMSPDDLTDREWILVGILNNMREKRALEKQKQKDKDNHGKSDT
jgi:hypothetical protein